MNRIIVIDDSTPIEINYCEGSSLLNILRENNIPISAPCGGNGKCGKCYVNVDGQLIKACTYYPHGEIHVSIPAYNRRILNDYIDIEQSGSGYGLAVDIGTTTVVTYLYDLNTGKCLASLGELNSQRSFGDNVISRIQNASTEEGLQKQCSLIRNQIIEMSQKICGETSDINYISIAGNTVMEHIFANISPHSIGVAPFNPVSLFGQELVIKEFHDIFSNEHKVYLAPAISGYVGGDITAGLLSSSAYKDKDGFLFIDIGTNGEIVLGNNGRLISCATAAGPIFDICNVPGSNVINLVAELLSKDIIDTSGRLLCKSYDIGNGNSLTEKDVRDIQLGKAAIRAGIDTLISRFGMDYSEIKSVYLAGGFGTYMNPASACSIGMIPSELEEKIIHVGNASGKGAAMALNADCRKLLGDIAKEISYEELSSSKLFNDLYIDAMSFE